MSCNSYLVTPCQYCTMNFLKAKLLIFNSKGACFYILQPNCGDNQKVIFILSPCHNDLQILTYSINIFSPFLFSFILSCFVLYKQSRSERNTKQQGREKFWGYVSWFATLTMRDHNMNCGFSIHSLIDE